MTARILPILALFACVACGPMNRVATRGQRVIDPEYTGFYQVLGEEHLERREYRRAWVEFCAIGDFGALRRVIETYAGDVQAFEQPVFDSMLQEYARAYERQFHTPNPLAHFHDRLHKVVEGHVLAASLRRATIAWDIERSYFRWLVRVKDRQAYFPQMVQLQQRLAGESAAGVKQLAARIQSELDAIRTDYHWK